MKTINLLEKLVRIDSVFPNEQRISHFLQEYLIQHGFNVETVVTDNNRLNVVATYGKSDKYLGFYGHMDTVMRDEKEGRNPLELIVEGNKAWGLGVEDMKGAIACILNTGSYCVENKIPLKIIFGVDEENISEGAHDLVDSNLLNNVSFLVVGESGQVKDFTQPFSICYGRKGRILYKLEIFGIKSHAADGKRGLNAIQESVDLINSLNKIMFVKHQHLGYPELVFQEINASTTSFSIPDKCTLYLSLLTTPKVDADAFEVLLKKIAINLNITISLKKVSRKTPYGEGYEVDKKNKFIKLLETEIFSKYNVKPLYAASVADENVFANRLNIPVISLGPIGGGGHTKEEWLDLKSLMMVEDVYKKIIELYNR